MAIQKNILVHVPEEQVDNFSQLVKLFFELLEKNINFSIPAEDRLDFLAKGYGFKSYLNLALLSKKGVPGKYFEILPLAKINEIASMIVSMDNRLEGKETWVADALLVSRSLMVPKVIPIRQFLSTTLRHHPDTTLTSKKIRELHLRGSVKEIEIFLRSINPKNLSIEDFQDAIRLAIKIDDVFNVQRYHEARPTDAMSSPKFGAGWRRTELLQISILYNSTRAFERLLKLGANINTPWNDDLTLVDLLINKEASNLLEIAINLGMVNPARRYLAKACQALDGLVFDQILRISDIDSIEFAIQQSLIHLNTPSASYLLHHNPSLFTNSEVCTFLRKTSNIENDHLYKSIFSFEKTNRISFDSITLVSMALSACDPAAAFKDLFFNKQAAYEDTITCENVVMIASELLALGHRQVSLLSVLTKLSKHELLNALYSPALSKHFNSKLFQQIVTSPAIYHLQSPELASKYDYNFKWKFSLLYKCFRVGIPFTTTIDLASVLGMKEEEEFLNLSLRNI